MAYANIPDGDIDADSPGNVSLFTRLRDNPEAIALGLALATRIQTGAYAAASVDQAAVGPGAIHRDELSTGTEQHSTAGAPSSAVFTLTAADGYSFLPQLQAAPDRVTFWDTGASGSVLSWNGSSFGDVTGNIRATTTAGGFGTFYIRFRYVSSSPPYDFGDGAVGRFVYAEVDRSGNIIRTSDADDPPWSGRIIKGRKRQDRETGKTYIWRPKTPLPGRWGECAGNPEKMVDYVAAIERGIDWGWVELTAEMKLSDMRHRPLPWPSKMDPSNSQIIIDPPSDILHRIQEVMSIDPDISPAHLLNDGYLSIQNTSLQRKGPPGVTVHGISWR